jgi:hypothetical protein
VEGLLVPPDWDEAAGAPLEALEDVLVPDDPEGFGPPTARIDGDTITVGAAGAGDRAYVLASTPARHLPPPVDPDVVGVEVRSTTGRYSPAGVELEWVEDGRAYSLRGTGLGLADLVALAAGMAAR